MQGDTLQLHYSSFFHGGVIDKYYLYFPKQENIRIQLPKSGQTLRYIFEGANTLTEQELKHADQFRDYALSNLSKDDENISQTIKSLRKSILLRFLQSSDENELRCTQALENYLYFSDSIQQQNITITSAYEQILNEGAFYSYGRDHCFRPICVFTMYKVINLVDRVGIEMFKNT